MDVPCGTIIEYFDGTHRGTGKVVGIATIAQPIIGRSYIVEIFSGKPKIPNKVYPYTHRIVFENQMSIIDCKLLSGVV